VENWPVFSIAYSLHIPEPRVDSKSVAITAVLMPVFKVNLNQATGYASQYIWCLSQARIKWEGYGRKGIRHKNVGMMEMGR